MCSGSPLSLPAMANDEMLQIGSQWIWWFLFRVFNYLSQKGKPKLSKGHHLSLLYFSVLSLKTVSMVTNQLSYNFTSFKNERSCYIFIRSFTSFLDNRKPGKLLYIGRRMSVSVLKD